MLFAVTNCVPFSTHLKEGIPYTLTFIFIPNQLARMAIMPDIFRVTEREKYIYI